MKILIDNVRLNLLLEQKKQFIGNRVIWDSVLSSVSFLISVVMASYHEHIGVRHQKQPIKKIILK